MLKKGGRISDAALNVIETGFSSHERPEPPKSLTERQQEIWRDVCRDEPLEHFATAATQQLLCAYCVTVDSVEVLSKTLSGFSPNKLRTPKGMAAYNNCLKAHSLASGSAIRLATKMRITNQSRYRSEVAETARRDVVKGNRTWD